jgi:hypothetical protein
MISATVNLIISAILLIGVVVLYILVLTGKDNNPTFDTITVKNIKLEGGLGITSGKGGEIQFYGHRKGQDQVAAFIKVEDNGTDWGTIMSGSGRADIMIVHDDNLEDGCEIGEYC